VANIVRDFISGIMSADTPEGMLGDLLESHLPWGKITTEGYKSARELYGDDFMNSTPDIRRRVLAGLRQNRNERALRGGEEGIAQTAGEFIGTVIKSPGSMLIPAGKTIKAGAANGFGFGVVFSGADQQLNTGEVDKKEALMAGAFGAVLGGGFNAALSAVGRRIAAGKQNTTQVRKANEQLVLVEEATMWAKRDGVPDELIPARVADDLDMSVDDVNGIVYGSSQRMTEMDQGFMESVTALKDDAGGWVADNFNNFLVPIHTRMEAISPKVAAAVRKYDFKTIQLAGELEARVAPFVLGLKKMSKAGQERVSLHLFNGKFDAARKAAVAQGMDARHLDDVIEVLDGLHATMSDKGITSGKIEGYFPRVVTNWKKLRKEMGLNGDELDRMMRQHAKAAGKQVNEFTDEERAWLVQNFIKGKATNIQGKRGAQRNSFDVTPTYLPHYKDAGSSLIDYVHKAADEISAAGLFTTAAKKPMRTTKATFGEGKSKVTTEVMDIESNVDAMLTEMHGFDVEGYGELAELLQARLTTTREPTMKGVDMLRSIGYMNTIGNPLSAATQFADVGISTVTKGTFHCIRLITHWRVT